jgi:phospholipid/cholesterol/gamma-HCH transport system substrate-binding protein
MAETQTSFFKLSPEAKVGLFVLVGIIILVYMSLRMGGITLGRAEGYTLTVSFDSAAGLDKDSSVRVAGVEVGSVQEIRLKDHKAHLTLLIDPDVKIGSDFTAVLTTSGLLGERYLELIPGSPSAPPLEEGGVITRTTSYADMDKLITLMSDVSADIKKVSENLGRVLGGAEGETSLRNIVNNLEDLSFRVNRLVENNDEKLTSILANLDEFTTMLRADGPEISEGLKDAIANLNEGLVETSKNLNQLILDNRDNLKDGVDNLKLAAVKLQEAMDTINSVTKDIGPRIEDTVTSVGSIAKKIDKGEGTIGMLINDPEMHENINKTVTGINRFLDKAESFHVFLGYRGEYLFDSEDIKNYLSLRIQPSSDKFYLLEVVDDPRGQRFEETRVLTTGGSTTTTVETKTSDDLKFSAQIAKNFRGIILRGGIIESTGGVGADLHLFKGRLRFSLDAFDLGQEGNPHLKAGATLFINRYFFLTAGGDDVLSRTGLESAYLGLGLEFMDDDIKYLFTSAPPVSF